MPSLEEISPGDLRLGNFPRKLPIRVILIAGDNTMLKELDMALC
jgi:hypothetical protein